MLPAGAQVGPYTVLDVLGRGSQGVVYLARREPTAAAPEEATRAAPPEPEGAPGPSEETVVAPDDAAPPGPDEPVALKVLRLDADDAARGRFAREAAAMAALRHEGIVSVLDHGSGGDLAWYAMERVEGITLERRILSLGAFAPEDAARLVARLARAVEHAHGRGIVHRDLKPSNVLLADADLAAPKISDFGLALVPGGTRLTQTHALVGTPCYMAPEVVRGDRATESADVYALGAILYECLAGRAPFEGTSIGAILHRVVTHPAVSPRRYAPHVPAALERICLACLEKEPGHRLPSAGALARALERTFGERESLGVVEAAREGMALARSRALRSVAYVLGVALGLEVGFLVALAVAGRL